MDSKSISTYEIDPIPPESCVNAWVAYWCDPETGMMYPNTIYAHTIDAARQLCEALHYEFSGPLVDPVTTDDWNDLEVDWEKISEAME